MHILRLYMEACVRNVQVGLGTNGPTWVSATHSQLYHTASPMRDARSAKLLLGRAPEAAWQLLAIGVEELCGRLSSSDVLLRSTASP